MNCYLKENGYDDGRNKILRKIEDEEDCKNERLRRRKIIKMRGRREKIRYQRYK